ncbi:hypothetical protein [Candidatus Anaplasma sp. TIGMIC]|uniref:hypothetical protein n=1 Tax=Candidatus Anaplasma sp. TIGMIC TaxID=3020713 RepID=UPI00232BE7CD|nr:hypothetical protein [Candidatus Anaplasma sp. TIGMIC]MDB1135393.1 hypothetical protein [Candidatus Anaplasma sp. TIGMIC]
MHGHGAYIGNSRSFSPWEQWSPGMNICFHERVAAGIEDNTLSVDKIASVVLQLLTRSGEIASQLLRELQYVDSTSTYEVNVPALEAAQRRIFEACHLLKDEDTADSKTIGARMLRRYISIIHRCYSAMLGLNTAYDSLDKWLYANDEKCLHITQMLILLVNAIDAMQQSLVLECTSEGIIHDARELAESLDRANQALRIVVNAFNAVSIPRAEREKIFTEKSVLVINASILTCTFKLLDMAARQAFSVNKYGKYRLGVYDRISDIRRCCSFRVAVLRMKALEYLNLTCKNSIQQNLYAAIWALDVLYDQVDMISRGTYAYSARNSRFATRVRADITECMTILALLQIAYKKARSSAIAKIIGYSRKLTLNAQRLCSHLESYKAYGYVAEDDRRKLHDVLTCLENVVENLTSIDKSQLPHAQWSSTLMEQAVNVATRACDACASELKGLELRKLVEGDGQNARGELGSVLDLLRSFVSFGVRYVLAQENAAFTYAGEETIMNMHGGVGGGYSDGSPTHSSALSPSSSLEDVVGCDIQSLAEVRQNSNDRSPTP